MSATESYLQKIGFTGDIDNLDVVLDFIEDKNIYIETKINSYSTSLGPLHEYSAKVYYISSGRMDKELITETPDCSSLMGVLRLSVLYAARYLSNKN